jgi:PIN domain nuclease of toxin-antitoxin system
VTTSRLRGSFPPAARRVRCELLGNRHQGQFREAPPDRFIADQVSLNGFTLLEASLRHVCRVADMPFHHRDPFDRVLVAQSLIDEIPIVSSERAFDAYGVNRIW